jgi:hypothetical protein
VITGLFTGIDFFYADLGVAEKERVGEVIVNEHISQFDAFFGAQGEQPRIAGAGPDEEDGARRTSGRSMSGVRCVSHHGKMRGTREDGRRILWEDWAAGPTR